MEGRHRFINETDKTYVDTMFDGEIRSNVQLTNLKPEAEQRLKQFEHEMERLQGEKVVLLAYSENKNFSSI